MTAGPYRQASPLPKSDLEVAIDAVADRIDALLRRSREAFLTRGEHRQIMRDLKDARYEHRDLVRRAEEEELHRRLIETRAKLIIHDANKVRDLTGALKHAYSMQAENRKLLTDVRDLRAHLAALSRQDVFVTSPTTELVSLNGVDMTCVDCVRAWLDPTTPACTLHARSPQESA